MTRGLRVTYLWCGWLFVVGVIDQAWGGWSAAMLLGAFGLFVALLAHALDLLFRWRKLGWRGVVPLAVCLATLPAIWVVGMAVLRARFHWNQDRYEALAEELRSAKHPASLDGEVLALARWAKVTQYAALNDGDEWTFARAPCVAAKEITEADESRVVAVHFLVVTHGFAGHVGFMRAFDSAAESCLERGQGLDGWWSSRSLGDHWYLVAN